MHQMDNSLKQKFAPRRNKHYAGFRGYHDEAEWASTLDWKANDYDFHRLFQSLFDHLDSEYREQFGLRVGQLVTRGDLLKEAHRAASWYQQEQFDQVLGIYRYLHAALDVYLSGKVFEALEKRRETAEEIIGATHGH
jgi:hypothetical protein